MLLKCSQLFSYYAHKKIVNIIKFMLVTSTTNSTRELHNKKTGQYVTGAFSLSSREPVDTELELSSVPCH